MSNHPLRDWRHANRLSATELAETIGVTKLTIYQYETGRRFPRPGFLQAIETATGGAITAAIMLAAHQAISSPSTVEEAPCAH